MVMHRDDLAERIALAEEIQRRKVNPLVSSFWTLTTKSEHGGGAQRDFVLAPNRVRVAEGGNQSGKTWVTCIDFLLQALGMHPTRRWEATNGRTWKGWYASTTYQRFAEQGWKHWLRLLLFEGEDTGHLPTRRILAIGWDKKNPERPTFLKLRRADGGIAEVFVKSYEQGAGEFQSAEVDCLALDEECPASIWEEAQPRVSVRQGNIIVSATPVLGVEWLDQLRTDADTGEADVYHCRFDARDNPAYPQAALDELTRLWRNHPEMLELRLSGIPRSMEGAVYKDHCFTREHVCQPFEPPAEWTRYRIIDPGFRHCGALWLAVAPNGDIVAYRDYKGEEQSIATNAREILKLSKGEKYYRSWMDPSAARQRQQESGKRLIDLWKEKHVVATLAPDNAVQAGIERIWQLLDERGGVDGEHPRFRVSQACTHFLAERRKYRYRDAREKGDDVGDQVQKRDDHLMDCWRYAVSGGLHYVKAAKQLPPEGTVGRRLVEQRRAWAKKEKKKAAARRQ